MRVMWYYERILGDLIMKKFLKYFICASMLVAGGASAAIGLNSLNSSAVKPAEALATDVGFDVLETSSLYTHNSGSDLNSVSTRSERACVGKEC